MSAESSLPPRTTVAPWPSISSSSFFNDSSSSTDEDDVSSSEVLVGLLLAETDDGDLRPASAVGRSVSATTVSRISNRRGIMTSIQIESTQWKVGFMQLKRKRKEIKSRCCALDGNNTDDGCMVCLTVKLNFCAVGDLSHDILFV